LDVVTTCLTKCELTRLMFVSRSATAAEFVQREMHLNHAFAKLMIDNTTDRFVDGFSTNDVLTQKLDGTEEALNAVVDIVLLAHADSFAGTMSSNFARLVVELGSALVSWRRIAPLALDQNWIVFP